MKYIKNISIFILIILASVKGYSQGSGELNRFGNESLSIKNEVKLFPNPSVDYLEVRINNATIENATFTVHNIIGNIVEVDIENVGESEYRLRVKDLAPGYYLLAIKDDQNLFKETYKFLKR